MWLQQRNTFCIVKLSWNDDRVENAELGLRADLSSIPENVTETTKGFTDPGAHLQIRATVVLDDSSQVLEMVTGSSGVDWGKDGWE